ncbi:Transcriptional regulatory protein pcoR [Salmonella enterica subsp. enterica serovar Senftenberg str. SS209]|nr:Transcriptional regulatory protein pcoR [Salmonella enterica subsp. enterica serovar Senftenberg str. SS209]
MQRILIVEDEQKTGRYLQQGLVEEGYQADLFNNGRDGRKRRLSTVWQILIFLRG